ncbi:MAG: serine/threonine protein kinase, partial [Planctomycetales bacterium]|nr:serine/threonine protein kinase [Planctomycetales bacterium]
MSSVRNPLEEILEQYMDLLRRGVAPPIERYALGFPEYEQEIVDLYPTFEWLEQVGQPRPRRANCEIDDLAGTTLGDYELLLELGRGGMGVVYLARHQSLDKTVAVKILPRHLSNETYRRRFLREAKSAARLHHSNIVTVFDFGESDGKCYYVMQYIAGQSLAHILRTERPEEILAADYTDRDAFISACLSGGKRYHTQIAASEQQGASSTDGMDDDSATEFVVTSRSSVNAADQDSVTNVTGDCFWRDVALLGFQVAEAIHYAHEQGILHRDIKPGNLLLDADGTVWITDFGLAKVDDDGDLTMSGEIVGTLRYMAPESLHGQADRRSDICSLGLTLYELVAHRPAYLSKGAHSIIEQIQAATPTRLRSIRPDIPHDLARVIEKAIERNQADRYVTAGAMAEDLRRFLNDEPILARRVSIIERTQRWCRRNPLSAALFASIALLLVSGAVGGMSAAVRMRELADAANKERDAALHYELNALLDSAFKHAGTHQIGQQTQCVSAITLAKRSADVLSQTSQHLF